VLEAALRLLDRPASEAPLLVDYEPR
jgi:hypothetical protein